MMPAHWSLFNWLMADWNWATTAVVILFLRDGIPPPPESWQRGFSKRNPSQED